MFYTYIIKSASCEWYYVGHASDLKKRLKMHNSGLVKSTSAYQPFEIVYLEEFTSRQDAISRERKIKKQRSLKESIIANIKINGPIV